MIFLPLFFACGEKSSSTTEDKKPTQQTPEPPKGCASDSDCTDVGKVCDTESGACVCDAENGYQLGSGGKCIKIAAYQEACSSDVRCANGLVCNSGICLLPTDCTCSTDCNEYGYGCYNNKCGCGAAGLQCEPWKRCENEECVDYKSGNIGDMCYDDRNVEPGVGLKCQDGLVVSVCEGDQHWDFEQGVCVDN